MWHNGSLLHWYECYQFSFYNSSDYIRRLANSILVDFLPLTAKLFWSIACISDKMLSFKFKPNFRYNEIISNNKGNKPKRLVVTCNGHFINVWNIRIYLIIFFYIKEISIIFRGFENKSAHCLTLNKISIIYFLLQH